MDIATIIIVIIAIIFVYSIFSMRRKPGENPQPGKEPGRDPGPTPSEPSRPRRRGKYGKWVGGGLGFVFGGPIGAILGVALGSMFDGMDSGKFAYRGTPRGDFAMSLLVLSAAVMKADQKVVKAELEYVRSFFIAQFGVDEGNRLVQMLREILKQDINVAEVSVQVGQHLEYAVKLQLLHYLFGIASADNYYHPDEVQVIEDIARYMNISTADYQSVKAMFVKNPGWAYDVLEIPSSATNEEVKKSFRELAKMHHPDKVSHLGEDVRKAATEKFQKINAAYEEIKKQRGMN